MLKKIRPARSTARNPRRAFALVSFSLLAAGLLVLTHLTHDSTNLDSKSAGTLRLKQGTEWQGIKPSLQVPAWFDGQNWDGGIPDRNTDVVVNNGSSTGRYSLDIPAPTDRDTAFARDLLLKSGGSIVFAEESQPGLLVLTGTLNVQDDGYMELRKGTLTVNGDVILDSRARCEAGSGAVVFSGRKWDTRSPSAFSQGTGTIVLAGSSLQEITGELVCYDLDVQTADTIRITGRVTVTHLMKISGEASVVVERGASLYVTGSFVNDGALSGIGAISVKGGETTPGTSSFAESPRPESLDLQPNFPNPFNPSTVIQFSLLTRDHATLRVYDIQGREIRTLFDEDADAGRTYRVTFDGSGLASGTYLYVLQSGGQRKVGRMIMQK